VIGGVWMKLHVFCFDLSHSDARSIKAYAAETTEAFLDGHVSAFAFFRWHPAVDPLRQSQDCGGEDLWRRQAEAPGSFSSLIFGGGFGIPAGVDV
jgi:hypothetical protein